MYREKKIGLVIPAYNEEKLIVPTLQGVPDLIDLVYVVDDCSPDNLAGVVATCAEEDPRVQLVRHEVNKGPGGAIITGYLRAAEDKCDVTLVVGGDNQMDLSECRKFLDPIIDGEADYTKGNRFLLDTLEDTLEKMPKTRLFGNWIITALTKIASGYYKVMDVVDGYTGISLHAIETINWNKAWDKYGYPMDFLIRLNAYGFRVRDIPRTAIYLEGERQSQIKGFNYALKVSPMLLRHFFWRLRFKYMYRDFHPLVLFYFSAFILIPLGLLLGLGMIVDKAVFSGEMITATRATFVSLILLTGFQSFLFAMLFDMQESQDSC